MNVVVTSHELLPKFCRILPSCPAITHLVYMEDPLAVTPTDNFKKGVSTIKKNTSSKVNQVYLRRALMKSLLSSITFLVTCK